MQFPSLIYYSLPKTLHLVSPISVPNFSNKPGNAVQSAEFLKKFWALIKIRNIMAQCMDDLII